jgi:hypothetical protein
MQSLRALSQREFMALLTYRDEWFSGVDEEEDD